MHAVRNLFRHMGGALLALTLALFVMGPTLDALICHNEIEPSAAMIATDGAQLAELDGGAGPPDSGPHQPCVHGHCHHSAQLAPAATAASPLTPTGAEPHAWPAAIRLATVTPSGLERPPRA